MFGHVTTRYHFCPSTLHLLPSEQGRDSKTLTPGRKSDPYSRLRVPKYQKVFEALFFVSFLALYYAVLVQRSFTHVTPTEVLLYVWITAFACEEVGEFRDAGRLFYAADFWSLWDIGIIGVGVAFLVASK